MAEEHYTLLDVIAQQFHTDHTFYSALRFLPADIRREAILSHMRNNASVHVILAAYLRAETNSRTTFTIPITLPANWDEPVTVAPTEAQMDTAMEDVSALDNTMCTICQEVVTEGTRLRTCRHCFHTTCIEEWLSRSVYCPVCRNDVRNTS